MAEELLASQEGLCSVQLVSEIATYGTKWSLSWSISSSGCVATSEAVWIPVFRDSVLVHLKESWGYL